MRDFGSIGAGSQGHGAGEASQADGFERVTSAGRVDRVGRRSRTATIQGKTRLYELSELTYAPCSCSILSCRLCGNRSIPPSSTGRHAPSPNSRLFAALRPAGSISYRTMAEQVEKSFQKQPLFHNSKVATTSRKVAGKDRRWTKEVGLGFKASRA